MTAQEVATSATDLRNETANHRPEHRELGTTLIRAVFNVSISLSLYVGSLGAERAQAISSADTPRDLVRCQFQALHGRGDKYLIKPGHEAKYRERQDCLAVSIKDGQGYCA